MEQMGVSWLLSNNQESSVSLPSSPSSSPACKNMILSHSSLLLLRIIFLFLLIISIPSVTVITYIFIVASLCSTRMSIASHSYCPIQEHLHTGHHLFRSLSRRRQCSPHVLSKTSSSQTTPSSQTNSYTFSKYKCDPSLPNLIAVTSKPCTISSNGYHPWIYSAPYIA